MAGEPTTTEPEAPEAPEEETELTPEEQRDYDAHVAELRAEWEQEYREQLRAEIRTEIEAEFDRGIRHGELFAQAAKELGVRPEAIEDVMKLGEWGDEGDEPDPKAIKAQIEKVLEGRDYLKAPGEPAPRPRLSADPLGNRGPSSGPQKLKITAAQLNNLEFMDSMKGKLSDVESWELADE
jgi:hypothetical protein